MVSSPLRVLTQPALQHARMHATAVVILLVRWLEGAAAWGVLYLYYAPHTVVASLLHLNFLVYALANLALYLPLCREGMTARLVWLDIVANLIPMGVAAYWSDGVHSPLLPIFVLKIASYGLIYSADVGLLSLITTVVLALGLTLADNLGWLPSPSVEAVPMLARMRVALAFQLFTFGIMIAGSLRFFSMLQERDARLEELVREKDRLYQESLRHQQNLRELSRNMMQSSEATMRQLVRELHDDLGQALTAVRMDLGMIDRDLPAGSALRTRVKEAREQISAVLQSMRNLSQLLRPPVLDDLGLVPAMQWYAERFRERTGVELTLEVSGNSERFPQPIEVALYRVFQEALTNVARHADAGHVRVTLHRDGARIALEISDDGCGFDTQALHDRPAADRGIGVLGMRERVATYGGEFHIESAPGRGTVVRLTIPIAETKG